MKRWQGGPDDPDHTDDVHIKDPVPLFVTIIADTALCTNSGTVHQDIESAKLANGASDRSLHASVVRNVRIDVKKAMGTDLRKVEYRNCRSTRAESLCGRESDSRRSSRHESSECHHFIHLTLLQSSDADDPGR